MAEKPISHTASYLSDHSSFCRFHVVGYLIEDWEIFFVPNHQGAVEGLSSMCLMVLVFCLNFLGGFLIGMIWSGK